jgi:hypothetical protein
VKQTLVEYSAEEVATESGKVLHLPKVASSVGWHSRRFFALLDYHHATTICNRRGRCQRAAGSRLPR